ncbi:MAG: four helix bundle protein [Chloroflexota bacterium]
MEAYGLSSQLQRSAVSVPSNIAEGHARQQRGDFRRFLQISLGSLAELHTQLIIAQKLEYISNTSLSQMEQDITEIQKMLHALISRLR